MNTIITQEHLKRYGFNNLANINAVQKEILKEYTKEHPTDNKLSLIVCSKIYEKFKKYNLAELMMLGWNGIDAQIINDFWEMFFEDLCKENETFDAIWHSDATLCGDEWYDELNQVWGTIFKVWGIVDGDNYDCYDVLQFMTEYKDKVYAEIRKVFPTIFKSNTLNSITIKVNVEGDNLLDSEIELLNTLKTNPKIKYFSVIASKRVNI